MKSDTELYFDHFQGDEGDYGAAIRQLNKHEKKQRLGSTISDMACKMHACADCSGGDMTSFHDPNNERGFVNTSVFDVDGSGEVDAEDCSSALWLLQSPNQPLPQHITSGSFQDNHAMFQLELELELQASERRQKLAQKGLIKTLPVTGASNQFHEAQSDESTSACSQPSDSLDGHVGSGLSGLSVKSMTELAARDRLMRHAHFKADGILDDGPRAGMAQARSASSNRRESARCLNSPRLGSERRKRL